VTNYFARNGEVEKYLPDASEELIECISRPEINFSKRCEQIQLLSDDDIHMLLDLFDNWSLREAENLD